MPAYNLPPPWSSGAALPDYVRIEDMQRRAFGTMQMPRGTYDAEPVGAAGYAVPNYVMEEGTGRGVYVTKWAPRGTAPFVAHFLQQPNARVVAQKSAASHGTNYLITNSPASRPFQKYGQKVANHLTASIKKLPPAERKPALKRLFDKVDPKLFSRVTATMTQAVKAGVPPARALHHAIATNFHSGIVRELQQVGATGQVKRASHVGLGCFGCAAIGLGDTAPVATKQVSGMLLTAAAADAAYWDQQDAIAKAAVASGAHWERPSAAGSPRNIDPATGKPWVQACGYMWVGPGLPKLGFDGKCPVPRVHPPGDSGPVIAPTPDYMLPYCGTVDQNGQPIKPCNPNVPAGFGKTINVGPLKFAGDATIDARYTWSDPSKIPPDVVDWVIGVLGPHIIGYNNQDTNALHYFLSRPGAPQNRLLDGDWWSGDDNKYPVSSIIPQQTHPYNNKQYGLFLFARGTGDSHGAPTFSLRWAPMDAATKGIWGEIKGGADTVSGWVVDAAKAIANAACTAVNTPGSVQAAAADPRAEAGVIVAKGFCGPGTQPTATPIIGPPPPSSGVSLETVLLIGGGLAAVYLLTR